MAYFLFQVFLSASQLTQLRLNDLLPAPFTLPLATPPLAQEQAFCSLGGGASDVTRNYEAIANDVTLPAFRRKI